MTFHELAQKVRELRDAVPVGPPSKRARAQKAYWSAAQLLYSRVWRIGGLAVPVLESAVFAAREEALDELEALARKRGDGLYDVLELLAIMRGEVR